MKATQIANAPEEQACAYVCEKQGKGISLSPQEEVTCPGEVTYELALKAKGRRQSDSMRKVPVAGESRAQRMRGTEQNSVGEGGGQGLENEDESCSTCV